MDKLNSQNTAFKPSLRALVVEDNQVDCKVLEAMLGELFKKDTFHSTNTLKGALELLEKHDFDVVVLDLNLPDSQGEETISIISERFPRVAIVVNTGAYEDDTGIKTLAKGAQDFLVKGKYAAYALNKVLQYAVERKRLSNELIEANKIIKETQAQLIQVEKMKVVGGLASGVAHEVKNPLATIIYGVTYLFDQVKSPDDKIITVLENIKEAAERANMIITDLLDFSALSELTKEETDIRTIIDKSVNLVHHHIESKKIQFTQTIDDNVPPIEVDRNRIEQVVINVLLNALNALEEGESLSLNASMKKGNEIALGLKNEGKKYVVDTESYVIIEIDDTGSGIPEDKVDKVFDPFFTTRRADGGVGLGLSVSKNIMELHEGHISIDNKKEGGVKSQLIFKVS